MKKVFYSLYILLFFNFFSGKLLAQNGESVFDFLRLPTSSHVTAIGGTNVSLIENDPSLVFQNPAFLGPEMDKGLSVGYLSYLADINAGSAIFTKAASEVSAWGVGINYVGYGNIQETTPDKVILGDLTVNDICVNGFYAHNLTERIRGGITAKFVYSAYAEYTSIGLGVDVGLSYYNEEHSFSMGLVGKNLGGQIKSYTDEKVVMPWDIQVGISQRLAHAPIRLSLTGMYLNDWDFRDLEGEEDSFLTTFAKHFVVGVDFIPSDNFWLGIGYNIKAAADMKITQGNKLGGFSGGAGIRVKGFEVGVAIAKFHPSATSLMLNLTTSL